MPKRLSSCQTPWTRTRSRSSRCESGPTSTRSSPSSSASTTAKPLSSLDQRRWRTTTSPSKAVPWRRLLIGSLEAEASESRPPRISDAARADVMRAPVVTVDRVLAHAVGGGGDDRGVARRDPHVRGAGAVGVEEHEVARLDRGSGHRGADGELLKARARQPHAGTREGPLDEARAVEPAGRLAAERVRRADLRAHRGQRRPAAPTTAAAGDAEGGERRRPGHAVDLESVRGLE